MIRRLFSLSLATMLLLAASDVSGRLGTIQPDASEIPKAATIEIILLGAPGIDDKESKWEINCEFRISNESTLWTERHRLGAGNKKRPGELIRAATVKKPLTLSSGRKVVFKIPFGPEIQKRLKNEPRGRVKLETSSTLSDARLLKDQEMKAQVFLFYSIINIYDARLKKNFIIPASRTWNFHDYREARFEIKVEINSDGTYSVKSSLPTTSRSN